MTKVNIGFVIYGNVWINKEELEQYKSEMYGAPDLAFVIDDLRLTTKKGFNLDYSVDESEVLEIL